MAPFPSVHSSHGNYLPLNCKNSDRNNNQFSSFEECLQEFRRILNDPKRFKLLSSLFGLRTKQRLLDTAKTLQIPIPKHAAHLMMTHGNAVPSIRPAAEPAAPKTRKRKVSNCEYVGGGTARKRLRSTCQTDETAAEVPSAPAAAVPTRSAAYSLRQAASGAHQPATQTVVPSQQHPSTHKAVSAGVPHSKRTKVQKEKKKVAESSKQQQVPKAVASEVQKLIKEQEKPVSSRLRSKPPSPSSPSSPIEAAKDNRRNGKSEPKRPRKKAEVVPPAPSAPPADKSAATAKPPPPKSLSQKQCAAQSSKIKKDRAKMHPHAVETPTFREIRFAPWNTMEGTEGPLDDETFNSRHLKKENEERKLVRLDRMRQREAEARRKLEQSPGYAMYLPRTASNLDQHARPASPTLHVDEIRIQMCPKLPSKATTRKHVNFG